MKGVKNVAGRTLIIKTKRKQGLGYTMTTKTTYEYTNKSELTMLFLDNINRSKTTILIF